jgi:hypothetical protein
MQATLKYQNGGIFIPLPNLKRKENEIIQIDFTIADEIMDANQAQIEADKELLGQAIMENFEAENRRLLQPSISEEELHQIQIKFGTLGMKLFDNE